MINNITKAFKIPDIRKRIIFTFVMLALFRLMAHVPVPKVDLEAVNLMFSSNSALGLLNLFSGGGMRNFSIVALSVGPYINSSIIFQLLSMAVPSLKETFQEGMYGKQKLAQYTRLLTLPLAFIQGYGIFALISRQNLGGVTVFNNLTPFDVLIIITAMVAGSFLLLWIGELITEFGIGNGVSILIFAGILSGITSSVGQLSLLAGTAGGSSTGLLLFIVVALIIIVGVVYVNEASRNINVQYSSHVQGGKTYGGSSSYIPIKINQAGVIPIIFAVSLVMVPSAIAGYLQNLPNPVLSNIGIWLSVNLAPAGSLYNILYFFLVFGFTYFYTAIVFNPEEIADNIRKSGGFIKGVRPGKATISYLKYIITRLTLAGGVFLGIIAIIPSIIQGFTGVNLAIGGTGILIVVSVVLETVKQIEAQVVTEEYESVAL